MTEIAIPEQTLEAARKLVEERFSRVDIDKPILKVLFNLGVHHVAKDMALNPKRYRLQNKAQIPEKHFEAVDPVNLIRAEIKLPSLPQIFIELRQVINNPSSSASDLARVISRDTAISAFMLRMVNSAFYSFPSKIDTISRAVAVIGTRQLSTLALGTSIMDMFKGIPNKAIDLELFWRHSFACATISQELAQMFKETSPERSFVAGLLHDIGRPVLIMALPERALAASDISRDQKSQLYRAERVTTGFDHAQLGGMLLRKWNLPFALVSAVLYHHNYDKAKKYPTAQYVYFANIITKVLGIGVSGNFMIPDIHEESWEQAGLTPQSILKLARRLDPLLQSAFSILDTAA